MASRTRDDWIELLEAVGVPCGPINDMAQVFADPQVRARQMRLDLPHPTAGRVSVPASALKLSQTPVDYRSAPPLLGQDTSDVLRSLTSLSEDELQSLRDRHLI